MPRRLVARLALLRRQELERQVVSLEEDQMQVGLPELRRLLLRHKPLVDCSVEILARQDSEDCPVPLNLLQ